MREIKLSGRERAVLRALDFSVGVLGEELQRRTKIVVEDLADILNGLCGMGFVEAEPSTENVTTTNVEGLLFDVNPSYALALREILRKN